MKYDLISYCNSIHWDYYTFVDYLYKNISNEDLKHLRGFDIKEKAYNFIHDNKPKISKELKKEVDKIIFKRLEDGRN